MFNKTPVLRKIVSPSCDLFQPPLWATHGNVVRRHHQWNIYKRQSFVYIPDMNNCDQCFIHAVLFIAYNLGRIGCLLSVNWGSQLWKCDPFVLQRVWEWAFCELLCLSKKQGALVSPAWGGAVSSSLLIAWRWAFMKGRECWGRGGGEENKEGPKGI